MLDSLILEINRYIISKIIMPLVNPFGPVPPNFSDLLDPSSFIYSRESERQALEVLGPILENPEFRQFKDGKWVSDMFKLATTKDDSDEVLRETIDDLRGRTDTEIIEDALRLRQEMSDWKRKTDAFLQNEARIFSEWREVMISRGIEHGFISKDRES